MNEDTKCSTSCSGSCSTCNEVENACPVCGKTGFYVPFETVYHLVNDFTKDQLKNYENEDFFICTHRPCKIAYYTDKQSRIFLNQIKVPIWFKFDKDRYVICYCRDITLDDVKEAINHIGTDITKKKVIQYLGKEDIKTNCLHNNPTGICCDRLFDNAIEYILKQKNK